MRAAVVALLFSSTALAGAAPPGPSPPPVDLNDRRLSLPRPAVLPCDTFRQVDVDVKPPGAATVAWKGDGGEKRLERRHTDAALAARDLPSEITVHGAARVERVGLTLSCAAHGDDERPTRYVSWRCGQLGSCIARVATSAKLAPGVRLCDGNGRCPRDAHDVRPAFAKRAAALSLLRALLAEAARASCEACRATRLCSPAPLEEADRIERALAAPFAVARYHVASDAKLADTRDLEVTARGRRYTAALHVSARDDGQLTIADVFLLDGDDFVLPTAVFGDLPPIVDDIMLFENGDGTTTVEVGPSALATIPGPSAASP